MHKDRFYRSDTIQSMEVLSSNLNRLIHICSDFLLEKMIQMFEKVHGLNPIDKSRANRNVLGVIVLKV